MNKHSLCKIVLLSLFTFFHFISFSQSENFKYYGVEEGLSQSTVHCIIQDSRGYLWCGTDAGGICRFDGKTFTAYTTADGLANNKIFFIREDLKGKIWINTSNGLSIFNGQQFIAIPTELKKIKTQSVTVFDFDNNGNTWIGTENGLFCWNGKTLVKNTIVVSSIKVIFKDSNGKLWIGTSTNGLYELSNTEIKHYTTNDGLKSNAISAITETSKGELWIATDKGLSHILLSNKKIRNYANQNILNVRSLISDNKGSVWVLSETEGIYKYTRSGCEKITSKQGHSANLIYCGIRDREGNIWIGTNSYGLIKEQYYPFSRINEQNGLHGNIVWTILHDSKGNDWFGTEKGTTQFITNKTSNDTKIKYFFDGSDKYPPGRTSCIIEDNNKNIWFTSPKNGVYKFDGKTIKNITINEGLANNLTRSLACDNDGNIWIATDAGLNKYDGSKFENFTIENGMPNQIVLAIFKNSHGELWFATDGGICKYNPKGDGKHKFISFTEKEGLPSNGLLGLTEDSEGHIWCGGFNGISRIDIENKKCVNISILNGLSSNSVYVLVADKKGNLYVGTNKGIDKINTTKFNKSGKIEIRHYGKEEGFTGLECNTNSYFCEPDGAIWFGSINGAARFDPSQDQTNSVEPLTHIASINLFFEKFDWTTFSKGTDEETGLPINMVLPYNKNHLTFNCVALSLTNPEKIIYSYKMEGFDKNWSPQTKQPFATYSFLPPGNYTFMVKAMNNDGVWTKTPAILKFKITAPFWQTWWFYLFSILILLFSIFMIIRIRLRALRKRAIELQDKIDQKTAELRLEKEMVESQSKIIEKKNLNITASINYAQRIQSTVLPIKENLQKIFPKSFILLLPRDIVSGDFYWFSELDNKIIVAAVDCTGHGIPGAFMSLIGNNLLEHVVTRSRISNPSQILHHLHNEIIITLKKTVKDSGTVDGMDISICVIDKTNNTLEFSSTGQPMILIRNGNAEKIKSGKYPLGLILKKERDYESQTFIMNKGDSFYLFTDGIIDQFSQIEDEKFSEERLRNLLSKICTYEMSEQQNKLLQNFDKWKGNLNQMDDILIIGIQL